ncbi:MAG TPA: maleylpyruvate isomerase family mycothiol-dependent enzyme [Nocardioidaceae bacterium]|nr:maleylpyruvate isomerase family mycothiol-dependent enzyme [Nocardioidaceae bacterium]
MTSTDTSLSTEACLAAIEQHSRGLAEAARGNLDAPVEHCPGWSVADLVWHVTEVHWFWATIADELSDSPPDQSRRPSRPADGELLDTFQNGARRLVEVLRAADQDAACWTWAPTHQAVAFITRHQVQEAAVHHWDAANAAGHRLQIEAGVAVDAVEEFLAFSMSTEADPAEPPRPALDGAVWICACVSDGQSPVWLIEDGTAAGTIRWQRVPEGTAVSELVAADVPVAGGHADPANVLLWLYGRVPDPWGNSGSGTGDTMVLDRLRALSFTD